MTQEIYGKYNPTISELADMVVNREQWKYDPRTDPAYQAYAKQYQRNAEQAYNRAMGSGGLYGSPSSYQQYQALAGYGDNMSQLSDAVPTLAQMDYQRYSDEQARNQAALEAMQRERAYEYDMLYNANENQLDRIKESDETNYNRHYDSMYRYPMAEAELALANDEVSRSAVDTALYPTTASLDVAIKQGQATATEITNAINRLNEIANRVSMNGGVYSTDDKAYLGIPEGANTKYWDAIIQQMIAEYQAQLMYGIG